jgi:hypothetical protein
MDSILQRPAVVVRASGLSGWPDCERRGAARLIPDEIAAAGFALRELPYGIGATIGTAIHKAASLVLKEKIDSGKMGPASVAVDCATDELKEGVKRGITWDRETPALDAALIQVERMTKAYVADTAPEIQPILVEERLCAQVTPNIELSGQADVIAREPGRVRDLKTGKRPGNHKPQIGAYSLLGRTIGPIDITEGVIDWVPRVSVKKPQPAPVVISLDIASSEVAAVNIMRHIEHGIQMFRNGDPEHGVLPGEPWSFTANPSSMLCGEKYCSAFGTDFCVEHAVKEEASE